MEEIIFPNQIRMYRRLRGRSMQELADHLGVSLSAISKIEKVIAVLTRNSWYVLPSSWIARCKNCSLMNKIPSRKLSKLGDASRNAATKLTKKQV